MLPEKSCFTVIMHKNAASDLYETEKLNFFEKFLRNILRFLSFVYESKIQQGIFCSFELLKIRRKRRLRWLSYKTVSNYNKTVI